MFLNKIQHSWEHSRQWFYREVEWFFWRVLGYFFFKKKFFTDHKMRGFHFHFVTVSKNLCVIKKIIKNLSQKLILGYPIYHYQIYILKKIFIFCIKFWKVTKSRVYCHLKWWHKPKISELQVGINFRKSNTKPEHQNNLNFFNT